MDHHSAPLLLLLLLTCLADGPSSVEISGVDVVTVGIPYGFKCTANCYPGCKYSWSRGNVTSQGPELSLQLLHIMPTQTLTCTVINPTTGRSATGHKTLQVTAGPSNIHISGPAFLTVGAESIFTCSANCYPSCSYSWSVVWKGETLRTADGNTIRVTPARSTVLYEHLICEAQDTVSHLYVSSSVRLPVASISDISIAGPSAVTMGKEYLYRCYALCIPSCSFSWKYMGKTFKGKQMQMPIMHQGEQKKSSNELEITLSDYSRIEPLTCEATNTVSHAKTTSTLDLTVTDPFSVHPISQARSVAGKSFILQCVGTQNPASVTWLKNKRPMPVSERVHFSPDNIMMIFSPLLQEDDGLYQCVVTEGGPRIQSVGYKMQVNYGPSAVVISGVDIMTAGKLYNFQCSASCYPTCQFTWTRGNMTSQGPKLSLQLRELQPTLKLTCTAVNPATGASVTSQKMLQVIAGPSNIHISGAAFLSAGAAATFTCSADCPSSCSYSWTVAVGEETINTAQGNTISVAPPANAVLSETLICKAQDTVSHLFIYKTLQLPVASLSNIAINGDVEVAIGKKYTYECFAFCTPSCTFTWRFLGKTYKGDQLEITVSDYAKWELLTCEAINTLSNATITATMNVTVIDPFSVRPTSQALPVAGKPFSLQCVGPLDPASITWLKNERQIPASKRVHFSPDNTTITFSSLLPEDGGLYQCLVVEFGNHTVYYNKLLGVKGGTPILSVGYLMEVNYGPYEVLIVEPNETPVGEVMFALPGSTTELQCLPDCFPLCSIKWFYHGMLLSTNASISFTPEMPPYEANLTCVASNPVTKESRVAKTIVVVPDGPRNVVIVGPDALEIGVTASLKCVAECTPSCSFKWTFFGKTMTGHEIDINVNRHISKESISCQAENTYTGKTVMVNETLSVSDPHWCGC
ncbi:hypothetical protein ABVT39_018129 [Epinephelus coioides]